MSLNKVGDILHAQGRLDEAVARYSESLPIAERLAVVDPSNSQWQVDLAASHANLALADPGRATENRGKAIDILEALDRDGRLAPQYRNLLIILKKQRSSRKPRRPRK